MKKEILLKENIMIDLKEMSKKEAIVLAGKTLVENGYVEESYVDSMLEREKITNTYIGNGIAIPHGTGSSKKEIKESGIVVLQFKDGIDYDGEKVFLVIGIAGVNDEHLEILSKIAIALQEMETVEKIIALNDKSEIYDILLKIND